MQTMALNRFHGDKWATTFSNLPSVDQSKIDVTMYDSYVKNVVLPDFFIETQNSDFMNGSIKNPLSRANDNLTQLTIEFKADEVLENYYNLYEWVQMLRYQRNSPNESTFRLNTIKSIVVTMLDNEKRIRGKLKFTNAIITNLGSLSLTMGSSEEITFAASFNYEEVKLEKVSIY